MADRRTPTPGARTTRVVVVGGGQAGLAAGYYLRRSGLQPHRDFVILDAAPAPGGAWPHVWRSLRLFSPAPYSSLPGWPMPTWSAGFPPAHHVVDYLARYEERYELPIHRPVTVTAVRRDLRGPQRYRLDTSQGAWLAEAVISATGTWTRPFWPRYRGASAFGGRQLHTADYRSPDDLAGQHVVVVGGGNSAAQILAEVSTVTDTTWITPRPPRFLPDDVDGRALFALATQRTRALAQGRQDPGVGGLGDIVMVPPVLDARRRGVLVAEPPFDRFTRDGIVWADGRRQQSDAVVWCTGFRPAVGHLAPLRLSRRDGHPATEGTRSSADPAVHLLGYGDWCGAASATLIGVGQHARAAVGELTRP